MLVLILQHLVARAAIGYIVKTSVRASNYSGKTQRRAAFSETKLSLRGKAYLQLVIALK